jgi:hypothetical protein
MTLLICLLQCLHQFPLLHPQTFLHTEDQQAHLFRVRYCRIPACPRGPVGGRRHRHMVHWWREQGRSGARGKWARNASRHDVEISLHERGGRGKGQPGQRVRPVKNQRDMQTRTCQLPPASFSSSRSRSFSLCLPLSKVVSGLLAMCLQEIDLSSSVMARSFSRWVPCRMSSRLLYSFRSSWIASIGGRWASCACKA